MNLTQNQIDAKKAFLNNQQAEMLAIYKDADSSERTAIIEQISSFLPVVSEDAKTFWIEFQSKLEKLNEQKTILFPLGEVFLTIGAKDALAESEQLPNEFLAKHQKGDYGIVCKEDWKENDLSVREGFRILSSYKTQKDAKIWVITEADRSSTTLLLPEEY